MGEGEEMKKGARSPVKTSFVVGFLGGTGFMAVVGLAFSGKGSLGLLFIGPVVVMAIHVVVVLREKGRGAFEVDSVYYLGFSFTLVSLAIGFGPILWRPGGVEVETVMELFAVALITTIVGLVVRVVLSADIEDGGVEEKAEAEVRYGLVALREEVEATLRGIEEWRKESGRHWERLRSEEREQHSKVFEAAQEVVNKLSASTEEVLRLSRENQIELGKAEAESVTNLAERAGAGLERVLEETKEKVRVAGEGLAETLSAEVKGFLSREREEASRAMEALSSSWMEHAEQVERESREALGKISGQVETGIEEVREVLGRAAASVETEMQGLSEVCAEVGGELGRAGRSAVQAKKDGEEALQGVRKLIGGELSEMAKTLGQVSGKLREAGEHASASLAAMSQSLDESRMRGVGEQLEELSKSLAGAQAELRSGIAMYKEELGAVQETSGPLVAARDETMVALEQLREEAAMVGRLPGVMRNSTEEMVADARASQEALREVMRTITEGVRALRHEVERV